jgi:hypothetical protein
VCRMGCGMGWEWMGFWDMDNKKGEMMSENGERERGCFSPLLSFPSTLSQVCLFLFLVRAKS